VESLDATRQLVQSDLSLMMGIASVIGTSIRNTAYIEHEKLLSEQLIHSQKLESIGQLSGGLAHDLNNILSVINGCAMLHQMKTVQTQDQARYIEEICAATERAAQLVKSLMAYSRRQAMDQIYMELNQLMRRIASFISRIVNENIELEFSFAEQPLIVFVDPVQIEQVMLNLVTNARDAMPDGGKLQITVATELINEVTCTGYEDIKAGNYATILVSDTGTGMHEDTRRRIFDPFFTTKEVGKGTGLGLSMSMGIITQHGGSIDVRSTPGTGTDFKLFLPLDGTADVPAETFVAEPDGTPKTGSGTILIAEDDLTILEIMEELLTKAGYRIITAMNGQDAVDKYSAGKNDIQLVISDMVMPLKSGKAACDEIRRIDGTVKFIFISGYPHDAIRCGEAFGDNADVIVKPLKALELLAKVKQLMDV
jgi:two-component system cell cycle sensor histidine kinase/response regulator CckA